MDEHDTEEKSTVCDFEVWDESKNYQALVQILLLSSIWIPNHGVFPSKVGTQALALLQSLHSEQNPHPLRILLHLAGGQNSYWWTMVETMKVSNRAIFLLSLVNNTEPPLS